MHGFGESIEDFQVLEQLGKGGFANVHRAICQKTFCEVAIKMINKQTMQARQMTERVRQEVAIHSRLKHPSILELYTFFEDADYVYLVLELAHNGELNRYFKANQKMLGEFEAAGVIQQVLTGLMYLHSHNICHRDMSLSNLLVTRSMKVKICDFGLATQLSHLSEDKHRTLCGTPNYISPEVASRSAHGLPADVWGLGCTLYTLLVGRPPFDTKGIKSTLTQVCIGNFDLPDYLSADAQDLIKRTLCKDPVKRITLTEIAEHPFLLRAQGSDNGINTISLRLSHLEAKSYISIFPRGGNSVGNFELQEVPKLGVPPLNTLRLLPTRHTTNNAILTILSSGEVVVEFVKYKMRFREARVVNVCRISSDGLRIVLYQPGGNHGLPIAPQPPELPSNGADHLFNYENLPTKHFKKYLYASRFIEMVQAKTPKVTFYSTKAKCQLMETRTDYEANFYEGEKIIKTFASNKETWKVIGANGQEIHLSPPPILNKHRNLIQHAEQCLQHCLQVEQVNLTINSQFSTFPIIIGRRPVTNLMEPHTPIQQKENTFNNYISAAQTPIRSPHLQMPSFSMKEFDSSNKTSSFCLLGLNRRSGFTKKTFIPGIGYADILANGNIQIQYSDCTQVTILSPEQGGGILYNAAPSSSAQQMHYRENDLMPDEIKMKMEQIPDVIKHLMVESQQNDNLHSSTPCSSRVGNKYLR